MNYSLSIFAVIFSYTLHIFKLTTSRSGYIAMCFTQIKNIVQIIGASFLKYFMRLLNHRLG